MIDSKANGDAGFTLIECLVSVAILGIAFAVLLGGMATAATTSDYHRKQATANTLLVSAAEAVKDDTRNTFQHGDCLAEAAYNPYTGIALPVGYTISVAPVQYWNGTAFAAGVAANCKTAYKLQKITITVRSPDGRAVETVSVVKGRS